MRYTTYHCGKAVIKDKNLLAEAMRKLAKLEDAEETIEPCITGECEGCTSSEEDCCHCMRAYSDCYETNS